VRAEKSVRGKKSARATKGVRAEKGVRAGKGVRAKKGETACSLIDLHWDKIQTKNSAGKYRVTRMEV
jgi:hypothetical protein